MLKWGDPLNLNSDSTLFHNCAGTQDALMSTSIRFHVDMDRPFSIGKQMGGEGGGKYSPKTSFYDDVDVFREGNNVIR